ncbi:hypothetical protein R5H30_04150 [Sulfitobacter sp. D35]|uniref:hypothetical protein n=1 Tax=Sulfitobacter sp. D35 TaxID=3083252 RepID=UPI00296F0B89|nr:hypothetical protein [Sulfitobacter sp. D35]MDW4497163.1 hypothetical protein [Sulfitobacter sp. D35]
MAVHDELIKQIEEAIKGSAELGYDDPAATNDVYENYVWAMCVKAAQNKGATVA